MLFENILEDGTLTATSETAGFLVANLINWKQATKFRWKATSTATQNIDIDLGVGNTAAPTALAIGGHNLFTAGASYAVLSGAASPPGDSILAATAATTDLPEIATWSAPTARRYWRIQITGSSVAPQIGVLTLGRKMDFTAGAPFSLDPYGEQTAVEDAANENGSYIGVNVKYTMKQFALSYDPPGMTATDFFAPVSGLGFDADFIPHAVRSGKPFWFAWNLDVDADEVYLCKVRTRISMPFWGSTARRGLNMVCEARREVS